MRFRYGWGASRARWLAASGGTLTVKCLNQTVPDYTIDLGPGEFGPWFNHSAAVTWLSFKNATTSLKFTNFSITATAKIFYQLNQTNPFGKAETEIKFAFEEPGVPDPEAIGDLLYDVGFYA